MYLLYFKDFKVSDACAVEPVKPFKWRFDFAIAIFMQFNLN